MVVDQAQAVNLDPDRPNVWRRPDGRWSYRASALGHCETSLLAARLEFDKMQPPAHMQRIFDEGKDRESEILAKVSELEGWRISGSQTGMDPIEIGSSAMIEGSCDGLGTHEFFGPAVVEAKKLGEGYWADWHRDHWAAPLFARYAWQVSCYIVGFNLPVLFVVMNKVSGEIHTTLVSEPLVPLAKLRLKVLTVEGRAARGDTPLCAKKDQEYPCPYWYLHEDEEDRTDLDDGQIAELVALADEYTTVAEQAKTAEARKKAIASTIWSHLPFDEETSEKTGVKVPGYSITPTAQTRTEIDWDAVAQDYPDFDLAKYQTKKTGAAYPKITPKKKAS